VFEGEYDRLQDKVEGLEARCEELNEACGVKQALLDHVAADERDFMELVEGYKRERDAEVAARQHQWDKRRKAEALLAAQKARAQRVEQALQEIDSIARDRHDCPLCPCDGGKHSTDCRLRAALSQPAATGEGTT